MRGDSSSLFRAGVVPHCGWDDDTRWMLCLYSTGRGERVRLRWGISDGWERLTSATVTLIKIKIEGRDGIIDMRRGISNAELTSSMGQYWVYDLLYIIRESFRQALTHPLQR